MDGTQLSLFGPSRESDMAERQTVTSESKRENDTRVDPFVPLRTVSGTELSSDLEGLVRSPMLALLYGPSGTGKSYAALRFAVQCSEQLLIVIVASAAAFEGDLDHWLDRSVEPFVF